MTASSNFASKISISQLFELAVEHTRSLTPDDFNRMKDFVEKADARYAKIDSDKKKIDLNATYGPID